MSDSTYAPKSEYSALIIDPEFGHYLTELFGEPAGTPAPSDSGIPTNPFNVTHAMFDPISKSLLSMHFRNPRFTNQNWNVPLPAYQILRISRTFILLVVRYMAYPSKFASQDFLAFQKISADGCPCYLNPLHANFVDIDAKTKAHHSYPTAEAGGQSRSTPVQARSKLLLKRYPSPTTEPKNFPLIS
jgi:hypothetical protein